MPPAAKLYIGLVIALGFSLLTGCLLFQAQFPGLPRYFSYLLLAVLASTLKVRLPGLTGTMSVNFLFILIGIADLTLAETLAMGCAATVIQCVWRAKRRPRLVHAHEIHQLVCVRFDAFEHLAGGPVVPPGLACLPR